MRKILGHTLKSAKGFTLLEMSIVLLIMTGLGIATVRSRLNDLSDLKAQAQGTALRTVATGVSQYIALESGLYASSPTVAGFVNPLQPTIAELKTKAYLQSNQSTNDLYGGSYQVWLERLPSGCTSLCTGVTGYAYITGDLTDAQGNINPPAIIGAALAILGSDGGTSTSATPNDLIGYKSGWSAVGANANLRPGVAGVLVSRVGASSGTRSGIVPWVKNIQTGTSYSTIASDQGKVIVFTNASPISVTLNDLPDGASGIFEQAGNGIITFNNGNRTWKHVANLNKTSGKYCRIFYRVEGTEVILSGDLS